MRVLHTIEKGIRLAKENSDTDIVDILFGSAAPGGDTGEQDNAPIGSVYFRTNGTMYLKVADTNATSDWQAPSSGDTPVTVTGITAATTVDSVLVDSTKAVKWYVQAFEEADPNNIKAFEIFAAHDGTAAADAAAADDTTYGKLALGGNFNLVLSVDLNGTGAGQTMRLRAQSSTAGVTVSVKRERVM